jgi:hypothetical protein
MPSGEGECYFILFYFILFYFILFCCGAGDGIQG